MELHTLTLLPPNAQRRCDQYRLPLNPPPPPDNRYAPSPPDHCWICPSRIQRPTFIPQSLLPIRSTRPSLSSILPIRWPTFLLHPTRLLAMQSTSLDRYVFLKDEGGQPSSTICYCSSITTFNRQYGRREKGQSMSM